MKSRRPRILVPALLICASFASPLRAQPSLADLQERNTEAFVAVVRLHAAELAKLPQPGQAGIWLVQDSTGHLISSGVLRTFPAGISSGDYGQIVPGAAGKGAIEFGFARTPVVDGAGPFRVAYVTVAVAPRPGGGTS